MSGLYDRDYSTLLPSEIEERDKLNKKYRSFKVGLCVPFLEYPKAVRHNLSLFPNNYLDIVDLKNESEMDKQCNEFKKILDNPSINELGIKHYIQDNGFYFIPASILSLFDFGHHDAYCFKEFPLGTQYRVDYLLIGKSSDGYSFVFVEFEHPNNNITISSGELGNAFRKGISQINDWKWYLESSFSSVSDEFLKYTTKELPKEMHRFDSSRMNYVVVAGRRKHFNEKTYRVRREIEKGQNIQLLHYDKLYYFSSKLIGKSTY